MRVSAARRTKSKSPHLLIAKQRKSIPSLKNVKRRLSYLENVEPRWSLPAVTGKIDVRSAI